jgi:5'-deoxynucleotidase YfbR-like HD superfamily hydrolase
MNQGERYKEIARFVQARLTNMAEKYPSEWHDPVYRWDHTLRVAQYGQQIARAEAADEEVVIAACLLHDVAHFDPLEDYKDHGREGAHLSRALLNNLGYSEEQENAICYAVAVHVDGVADFEHDHTLEADIVSDADNIDRFGAFRILQWCAPGMDDFGKLADNLRKRVAHLEGYLANNPLETATGQAIFTEQLQRQIAFFRTLIDEYDLSHLPSSEI